ncbi:hypothetical protein SBOR_5650 [Sclerotinia borealis F-4128]|uniref:Uncharacterized protein n=1 Tax=Sclerotinia borealis (strain F-4128) TaxID=1432307 RepID=W9CB25_SCLBF|nr:hypothetical protein SBOR_5650 [Sclerotinia borealis F-4128]
MSYPPRTQPHHVNVHVPRARSKKGQPLDPDDLSRRLKAHLAQQKALAEHRREARASETTGVYHHIPQVAALSFENTATPDKLRQVHKLSEPALKNLRYLTIDEGVGGIGYEYQKPRTILQKSQFLDHETAERTMVRNRNQYQWTAALERAAELDAERDVYKCPRRTFNSDAPAVHKNRAVQRPMSMGGFLPWGKKEEPKEPKRERNDRHDWTQRDEYAKRSLKERVGPLLSLKLRKGKVHDGSGEDKSRSPVKSLVSPSIRASFFWRFKISPSN